MVYSWWRTLASEVYTEVDTEGVKGPWNLSISGLKESIEEVEDEDKKRFFEERFTGYTEWSRKPPAERSEIYDTMRELV